MTPTPEDEPQAELVAYLDGELDEHATQELEQQMGRDPQLRARADALKKTWELLDFLPQPEPTASFTSRTLDRVSVSLPAVPAVVPKPASAAVAAVEPPRPWPRRIAWIAVAVTLFVVAFIVTGAVGRKTPKPDDPQVVEEQMAT